MIFVPKNVSKKIMNIVQNINIDFSLIVRKERDNSDYRTTTPEAGPCCYVVFRHLSARLNKIQSRHRHSFPRSRTDVVPREALSVDARRLTKFMSLHPSM